MFVKEYPASKDRYNFTAFFALPFYSKRVKTYSLDSMNSMGMAFTVEVHKLSFPSTAINEKVN